MAPMTLFFSSRRRHTRFKCDWSSDVCSSDLPNLEGPSDKTVAVIEFLSATGEPIAVYMDYAMHPVNGFLAGLTSADFAGAASRYVEQAFDEIGRASCRERV